MTGHARRVAPTEDRVEERKIKVREFLGRYIRSQEIGDGEDEDLDLDNFRSRARGGE